MTDIELTKLAGVAFGNPPEVFSPLTDDGDSLRLAVKLKFDIEWDYNEVSVNYTAAEFEGDDPYAATRRSIVRAAAEIGRSL